MVTAGLPAAKTQFPKLYFRTQSASVTGIPAMHGIYRVVCTPMRLAYVGQAFDLAHRALEHQVQLRDGLHPNPRLQAAYNRFGPSAFYLEVLEIWTGRWSPDCLSPAEQRWMDLHTRSRLFNIRPAGSDVYLEGVLRAGGKPFSSSGDAGTTKSGENRPLGRAPGSAGRKKRGL